MIIRREGFVTLPTVSNSKPPSINPCPIIPSSKTSTRRRFVSLSAISSALCNSVFPLPVSASEPAAISEFFELTGSTGIKALDLRLGSGQLPLDGDQVAIHCHGRLAAKQGWRFDSTYDHKDESGEPNLFVFVLGNGKFIPGIEAAVRSMRVGGIRRVIIPPSQGYQNT